MHEWARGRDKEAGGGGTLPCISALLPRSSAFHWTSSLLEFGCWDNSWDQLVSLHLSSNKVGHVNICIYALHFTWELESSCLCWAISPTLKQPFRDGTWTREYSVNTIYYLFLSSDLKPQISLPWESSILSVSDLLPGALLQWKKKYLLTLPQLHFLSSWRRCLCLGEEVLCTLSGNIFLVLFKLRQ